MVCTFGSKDYRLVLLPAECNILHLNESQPCNKNTMDLYNVVKPVANFISTSCRILVTSLYSTSTFFSLELVQRWSSLRDLQRITLGRLSRSIPECITLTLSFLVGPFRLITIVMIGVTSGLSRGFTLMLQPCTLDGGHSRHRPQFKLKFGATDCFLRRQNSTMLAQHQNGERNILLDHRWKTSAF